MGILSRIFGFGKSRTREGSEEYNELTAQQAIKEAEAQQKLLDAAKQEAKRKGKQINPMPKRMTKEELKKYFPGLFRKE